MSVETIHNRSLSCHILVANIGSTSFKYRLYRRRRRTRPRRGADRAHRPARRRCPDYDTAIRVRSPTSPATAGPLGSLAELAAIGFKAVHAGPVSGARLVDDEVLAAMEEFAFFAPAHNPPYVAAMRSFRRVLPRTCRSSRCSRRRSSTACREAATTYAVPFEWQDELGRAPLRVPRRQPPGGRRARAGRCSGGRSATSPVTSAAAPAWPRSATASPSTRASACRRSRACRRTTACGDLDVFAALFVMKKRGLDPDAMARRARRPSRASPASAASAATSATSTRPPPRGNARARLALDVFVHADPPLPGRLPRGAGRRRRAHLLRRDRREQPGDPRGRVRRPRRVRHRARPGAQRGGARRSAHVDLRRRRACRPHRAGRRGADRGARDRRGGGTARPASREADHGR